MLSPQLARKLSSLALLYTAALLPCGCKSTDGPAEPSLYWSVLPTFSPGAAQTGNMRVEWKNPVAEPALDSLVDSFKEQAKAKGFEITTDLASADYIYCFSVRFFGVNPKEDRADNVLAKAGADIAGGYPDWLLEGIGEDNRSRTISVVSIEQPEESFGSTITGVFGKNPEWCILLDVAVGERRRDASGVESVILRRDARLVGWISGVGEDRKQALEAFKRTVGDALKQILP